MLLAPDVEWQGESVSVHFLPIQLNPAINTLSI